MPYIEGETLRGKLNRETQCGVDEAVRITMQVADALDYAHRHGIIHKVAAAVAKSLAKLPADRFDSAKAFADALGTTKGSRRATEYLQNEESSGISAPT